METKKIFSLFAIISVVTLIASVLMHECHFHENIANVICCISSYTFFISGIVIMVSGIKEVYSKLIKWCFTSLVSLFSCGIYGVTAHIVTNTFTNIPNYLFIVSDVVGYIALISLVSFVVSAIAVIICEQSKVRKV